jgi:hypothetical protein
MRRDRRMVFATLLLGALSISAAACADLISSGEITGEVLDCGADACAFVEPITLNQGTIQHTGATCGEGSLVPGIGYAGQGPEQAYQIHVEDGGTFGAKLETYGWDGAVYLRHFCDRPDQGPVVAYGEDISLQVVPGTFHVIVDGKGPNDRGDYRVTFTLTAD